MGIVAQARDYLANNAAESGADVLIEALVDEVERLMPKPPTPARLAKIMRQWRKEKGLTTAEAGAALDLSPRTIEGIEQGKGFAAGRVLELALLKLTET